MAYCGTCASLLSFPTGARFILCPACKKTMNPDDEQHTMCSCCRTLLSHPSRSLYIQCPVCLRTQNIREKRVQAGMVNMIPLPQPTLVPTTTNNNNTNDGSLEGQHKPDKVDPSAMMTDNGQSNAATSPPKAHEGSVQENEASSADPDGTKRSEEEVA